MSKAKLDRQGNYIYIGVYDCEMDVVGLLGEVGTANGHVFFPWAQEKDAPKARHSKVRGMCYVTVGLDQRYWSECIEILLHEILEYEFVRMNVRYNNSSNLYDSAARHSFNMTHEQYGESVAKIAPWLTRAMPALKKLWKRNIKI